MRRLNIRTDLLIIFFFFFIINNFIFRQLFIVIKTFFLLYVKVVFHVACSNKFDLAILKAIQMHPVNLLAVLLFILIACPIIINSTCCISKIAGWILAWAILCWNNQKIRSYWQSFLLGILSFIFFNRHNLLLVVFLVFLDLNLLYIKLMFFWF